MGNLKPGDLLAWGQYIHWTDLQFRRYRSISDEISESDQIGIVCHWLAAEYVVLEGWKELNQKDDRIDLLISLYPEHCEALRRCRNAVYHFQKEMLDGRIRQILNDENEELKWTIALHFEFQRFLFTFPYRCRGTLKEKQELEQEIKRCIGWLPTDIISASVISLYNKCMDFSEIIGEDRSRAAVDAYEFIESSLKVVNHFEGEPPFYSLKRIIAEGNYGPSPLVSRLNLT